jgi:hypothetical protein
MMGSLFAMSVAALLVVGAQFWYIIVRLFFFMIRSSSSLSLLHYNYLFSPYVMWLLCRFVVDVV